MVSLGTADACFQDDHIVLVGKHDDVALFCYFVNRTLPRVQIMFES